MVGTSDVDRYNSRKYGFVVNGIEMLDTLELLGLERAASGAKFCCIIQGGQAECTSSRKAHCSDIDRQLSEWMSGRDPFVYMIL